MTTDRALIVPPLGDQLPKRGNAFTRAIARGAMRLTGWRFDGGLPDLPRFVLIVAPHTSNWDFMVGVMAMFALGIRGTFLGKHTLFRWPMGPVMRWLGGLPVIRSSSLNQVEQTVQHVRASSGMILALSPEGTRKKLPAWRSGFYYVAKGAEVPIVPVAFDYAARMIRIFPVYRLTDDVAADLAALGSHFHAGMALNPSQY
jgi:1-acyl-sn-glycerol-3-phosphate acyltransferase